MKIIRLFLFLAFSVLMSGGMEACSDDSADGGGDNFDVPELTSDNTISFTVNAAASRYVEILLKGQKVAVDWGDGEITKRLDPEQGEYWRVSFQHTYRQPGEYMVKIWSDELTFISLSGLLRDYADLKVGKCPLLKEAMFNTIPKGKMVNVNDCPLLETLEVSNCEEMESVALDKCVRLSVANFYTLPELRELDLSKNTVLNALMCADCPFDELLLPNSLATIKFMRIGLGSLSFHNYDELRSLECLYNPQLTSLDLSGCGKLEYLNISNTGLDEIDFPELPELRSLDCSSTLFKDIDLAANTKLYKLSCENLGLTFIDVSKNTWLSVFNCGGNELALLDISNNTWLNQLYINGNQFDRDGLETIFDNLSPYQTGPVPVINFSNNPGSEECNTQILTDKRWYVRSN